MSAVTLKKLDALAMKIADAAPIKTHKYFRIAVPQAITGQTLVQIVTECSNAEDSVEGLHLATLLLRYGYIFSVIEDSNLVKDDNTLYRLQLPYFWPSNTQTCDLSEYAIYLNKRLMRNELKHGLDEDEVQAYNKSIGLLGHMWGFITAQAELQLKLQKERKKSEKVVYDSEERAFWRLRRPGAPNALELPQHKLDIKTKKLSDKMWAQVVERLKLAYKTKPWLKAGKASEIMVSWCSQFHDYDAFMTPSLPPNPWVSDDNALWVANTDLVEVPTEKRVRRWAINVTELTRDPIGRQVLETFLESEFSSENIRFWMAIQDLKYAPDCQIDHKSQRVHDEFLASGAPCQINVDSRTLDHTLAQLRDSSEDPAKKRWAFSLAEENVFTLMSKDSYPRFIRSQIYKGVLSAAQQQGSKRLGWRNFIFNMGMGMSNIQKRTPLTSKHKMSRDDNSHSSLPKQLSSDSLPLKQPPQSFISPSQVKK